MNKQRTILLSLVLALMPLSLFAQANVEDIRKWYGEVENNKGLKSTTFSVGEDGEDLELKRYVNAKGDVVKVQFFVGGEHGSLDDIYYYKDGLLFFILRTEYGWRFAPKKDENVKPRTIDSADQSRIYVNRGKVVKLLLKSVETDNPDALEKLLAKKKNKEGKANADHAWAITLGYAAKFVSSKEQLEQLSQMGM